MGNPTESQKARFERETLDVLGRLVVDSKGYLSDTDPVSTELEAAVGEYIERVKDILKS